MLPPYFKQIGAYIHVWTSTLWLNLLQEKKKKNSGKSLLLDAGDTKQKALSSMWLNIVW